MEKTGILVCRGRVDEMGDPDPKGSYIGITYNALHARHHISIGEGEAVQLAEDINRALAASPSDRSPVTEGHTPVAWAYVNDDGECEQIEWGDPPLDPSATPLYSHPPANAHKETDDYVLVPKQPTPEMISAARPMYAHMIADSEWPFTINLWRTMLAAAPPVQAANAHAELVEALREAAEFIEPYADNAFGEPNEADILVCRIRAILSKLSPINSNGEGGK